MKTCKDGRRERDLVIRLPRKVSKEQTSIGTGMYLSSPSYLGSCCRRIAGTQKLEASLDSAAKALFLNKTEQYLKGKKQ